MRKQKLLNSICLATAMSLALSLFPVELHAEVTAQEESVSKESEFDENAHGEVVKEGYCGLTDINPENVQYKLYEDGMLYIYGNGIIEKIDYEYIGFSAKSLYIEDGITGIRKDLFYNSNIGWIRFPNTLVNIGENAFRNCQIKKLVLPDGLKSIEDFSFGGCDNLEIIYIPESMESIKNSSFAYCSNIKQIEISEKNKIYDSRENCNSIIETNRNNLVRGCMNTIIPKGIVYIGEYSFSNCFGLEDIEIPDGVEEIGQRAFIGCENLKSIKLPSSLKYTGEYAFHGCDKLHKHNYEEIIEKEPTCTESGIRKYICSCGDEYTEEIPAIGKPTEPEASDIQIKSTFNGCKGSPVKLSITCKENDEFTFECKDNCGTESKYTGYSSIQAGEFSSYSKNYELIFDNVGEHIISAYKNGNLLENDKIIIAENHTWDSGKIERKPTCTKNGKKKFTCSNCENSYTEEILATGHEYIERITRKETCVLDGVKTYTCSNCRDSYTERIPAIGHNYIEKLTKKETCEQDGIITYTCSNCNDSYTKSIPHINHNYVGKITKRPGCTSAGIKTYTCSNCKKTYTDTIPATKHKYSSWKTSKKPTIFKNGTKTRKCSNCGKQETKTIKKLKASVSIKKKASVKAGKSIQLKIYKKSKGDKISNWTSSKKSVATVNKKGKVTARKKGKAKITVKMKSGCKATCTVTVK